MNKIITIVTLFFLGCLNCIACSCDTPTTILEFYNSKYVFEGVIINKTFTKDSAAYTVKFKVLRNYKKNKLPEELSFVLDFQKKNGMQDSCYPGELYENQKMLVFAQEWNGGLSLSRICSNTQTIRKEGLDSKIQKILDTGNKFKLDHYIYDNTEGIRDEFNYPKPVTNIDTVFKNGKQKKYESPTDIPALLMLFVDKKGNLVSVYNFQDWHYSREEFKYDPVFGLLTSFKVKSKRPLTEFEEDAIALAKQIKKWDIKRHKNTQIAVDYVIHLYVDYNSQTMKWSYEI